MSGCPGKVGLNPVNNRYIQHRVSCMRGVCGIPRVHGVDWRVSMNNTHPYCAEPSSKCLAAAGGIGNIYTPYFKSLQPGKQGCTNKDQFGFAAPNANIDPVFLKASDFPYGAKVTTNADGSLTVYHGEVPITIKGKTLKIPKADVPKLPSTQKSRSPTKAPDAIRVKKHHHGSQNRHRETPLEITFQRIGATAKHVIYEATHNRAVQTVENIFRSAIGHFGFHLF